MMFSEQNKLSTFLLYNANKYLNHILYKLMFTSRYCSCKVAKETICGQYQSNLSYNQTYQDAARHIYGSINPLQYVQRSMFNTGEAGSNKTLQLIFVAPLSYGITFLKGSLITDN